MRYEAAPHGRDAAGGKGHKSYKESFMKRERVYLRVPFAEKEEAKRLGARWDQESKRWFISGERDLTPLFQMATSDGV